MKTNTCYCALLKWTLVFGILIPQLAQAQKINYSETEKEDTRRTDFEIIGKVGGNILIFKGNRTDYALSVYDNEMKLKSRVKQQTQDKWINVDFVAYNDFCWLIYQYERRNIVHCMAAKIDGNGKRISEPIELDTTRIGGTANNKIYSTIFSDDKQRIMVFKINSRNSKNFVFTTMLYDASLNQLNKHVLNLPMDERNDYFTDFLLDNEGDLVFGKFTRRGNNEYVSRVYLITKKSTANQFNVLEVTRAERLLDDIKLKTDNANRRYHFTSLYYKERNGNIEGIVTAVFDKQVDSFIRKKELPFSEDLRRQAKGPDANLRLAFNDYFITSIIIKRSGGYLVVAESDYTSSRGSAFNRWDYMYWNNPWMTPYDYSYYSPYSYNRYYSPWNRNYNTSTRYHSENIMVLSFDPEGVLEWTNVIPKTQFDDDNDALISHLTMVTGGELHFLYNLYERRALLLNNQSVSPDGKLNRYPTLKNLDREIEFMPRYGKQIGARTLVLPCLYRNYLTFAKIEF